MPGADVRQLMRTIEQLQRRMLTLEQRTATLPVRFGMSHQSGGFWGALSSPTAIPSTSNRWSYSFAEQEYQSAGTFAAKTGGKTGTCYNTMEANNAATGVQGSGDDVDNLDAGVAMQPMGVGAVVWISPVRNCDDGSTEYVFEDPNNPGGDCSA